MARNLYPRNFTMADLFFLALLAGFGVITWGLLALCERLMGDKP